MPISKCAKKLGFSEESWIISVMNTGSALGGHAVLLVEGMKQNASGDLELYIAQFDITAIGKENTSLSDELQIQFGNALGHIAEVRCYEDTKYPSFNKDRVYSSSSNSHCCKREHVESMIKDIKEQAQRIDPELVQKHDALEELFERKNQKPSLPVAQLQVLDQLIETKHKEYLEIYERKAKDLPLFQLAGNRRAWFFGGNEGHNCATWALEKLDIALQLQGNELKKTKSLSMTESIKTSPYKASGGSCSIM